MPDSRGRPGWSTMMLADRGAALSIAVAGGIGGGLNATLCLLGWPVRVSEPMAAFRWHVLPAGVVHGALLALAAMAGVLAAERLGSSRGRWCAIPVVGWLAGYASWIPLEMSVFGRPLGRAIAWPAGGESFSIVWSPLIYFGGVSAFLASWLLASRPRRRPWLTVVGAVAAATAGSLYWWIVWGPWYFSLLHGAVWGSLVGLALVRLEHAFPEVGRGAAGSPPLPGDPPPLPGFPPRPVAGTL